jgi:hypothetical protein
MEGVRTVLDVKSGIEETLCSLILFVHRLNFYILNCGEIFAVVYKNAKWILLNSL